MAEKIEFKFDTQLLIDGHDLSEDAIDQYIRSHFEGDSLLADRKSTRLNSSH